MVKNEGGRHLGKCQELCITIGTTGPRLQNVWRKHLRYEQRLVTQQNKRKTAFISEMFFNRLMNMSKLKNILRQLLKLAQKIVTDKVKPHVMRNQDFALESLEEHSKTMKEYLILRKHLRSELKLVTENEKPDALKSRDGIFSSVSTC